MIAQTIYISGPVTGMPGRNEVAFRTAADALARTGYTVINPLDVVEDPDMEHGKAMRLCLAALKRADGVCLLDGWEKSQGALQEYGEALHLGIECKGLSEWIRERGMAASKGWR